MATPALSTFWHWLRARAGEWAATSLLPPPTEKLRWPHQVKLYLLLSAGITFAVFLFFFASFFDLCFTGLRFSPPPLSLSSLFWAIVRCWRVEDVTHTSGFWLAAGPLQIVSHFWNKRAVRLAEKQAALAASADTIWPPPPAAARLIFPLRLPLLSEREGGGRFSFRPKEIPMTRPWKTAAVAVPLTLAALALGGYAYSRAHAAPTYRLVNGIAVTPLTAPTDDVADVLGIKTYQFDVVMPDAAQGLELTVNSCRAGKIVQSLGGGGFRPLYGQKWDAALHITLILAPDDQDFSRGSKVKYLLKSPGTAVSGKFSNPLQGSGGLGYAPDEVSKAQNSVYLIGGGKMGGTPVQYDDVSLALTFAPLKPL